MKITRIVLEEEEVVTAEVHETEENDGEQPKKAIDYDIHSKIEEKARKLYAELSAEDESNAKKSPSLSRQNSLKSTLYDIEEKSEVDADLTPEEARQQRIKDIRARARRASLQKQDEPPEESEIQEETVQKPISQPLDVSSKPPNGKRKSIDNTATEPNDAYTESLLRQAQRQRSVLDEIVDQKERSLSRSRDVSRQSSLVGERRRSCTPELEGVKRFESDENRPNFKADIEDCEVAEREPIKLEAKIEGQSSPKVQWFKDGEQLRPDGFHIRTVQNSDGATQLLIDEAEPTDSGEYQVIASNEHGIAASCAKVIVNEVRTPREKRPTFVEFINSFRVVEGYPATLEAKVKAHPEPSFAWFHDGEPIESDSDHIRIVNKPDGSTICMIDAAQLSDRGEYKVVASNELGKSFSSGYMAVSRQAIGSEAKKESPRFIADLHDRIVDEGKPVTLRVKVAAYPAPGIKWLHNGEEIRPVDDRVKITQNSDGSSLLEIERALPKDSGEYICIAANDSGACTSKAALKVVYGSADGDEEIEKPIFISKPVATQELEVGDKLEITAEVDSKPIAELKWLHNGHLIEASEHIEKSHTPEGLHKLTIERVEVDDSGEYVAIATNDAGTVSSCTRVIVKSEAEEGDFPSKETKPTFVTELKDAEVPEGSSLDMKLKVNAYPNADVKWLHDDEEIDIRDKRVHINKDEAGNLELTIDDVQPSDSGEYTIVASNHLGSTTSKAVVSVTPEKIVRQSVDQPKPVFVKKLEDVKAQVGSSLGLKVKIRAYPNTDVKWMHDDKEIDENDDRIHVTRDNDGNIELYIDHVQSSDSGEYKVIITNDAGTSVDQANVSVTPEKIVEQSVDQPKPVFIKKLEDVKVQAGSSLGLKVKIRAYPNTDIKWIHDDEEIDENDKRINIAKDEDGNIELTIDNVQESDSGEYKVLASNKAGTSSTAAHVSVTPEEIVAKTVDQPKPVFVKQLEDVKAQVGSSLGLRVRVRAYPNTDVKWMHDDEQIDENDKRVNVTKDDDGNIELSIDNVQQADAGVYKVIVSNKSGSSTSKAIVTVTPEEVTEKSIDQPKPVFVRKLEDVKAQVGSSLGLKVRIRAYPNTDVKWMRNDEEIDEKDNRINVTKDDDGNIELTIDDVQLADAGEYKVIASNKSGSSTSKAIVTVTPEEVIERKVDQPKPVFIQKLEDVKAKVGSSLGLKVRIRAYPNTDVKWMHNDEEVDENDKRVNIHKDDDGNIELTIDDVKLADGGAYTVIASNDSGSASSDAIVSIVPREEKPTFVSDLHDTQIQSGALLTLKAQITPDSNADVKWLHNGDELSPEHDKIDIAENADGLLSLKIDQATVDDSGEYTVVASNPFGKSVSSANVQVNENDSKPFINEAMQDQKVHADSPVTFQVNISGQPKPKLQWYHDDEEIHSDDDNFVISKNLDGSAALTIANASPSAEGTYKVVASNKLGCVESDAELIVLIKPEFEQILENVEVIESTDVLLEIKVCGSPMPDLEWFIETRE